MADRPIIFSGPMVRALLAGRKTQTRRLATSPLRRCEVGDRLYVRESCYLPPKHISDRDMREGADTWPRVIFAEDDLAGSRDMVDRCQWRSMPSIHMPRWASRLTLTVSEVRVQRLDDISREDAIAEGLIHKAGVIEPDWWVLPEPLHQGSWLSPIAAYRFLWNSLHTKPGETWADNPEIVALTFTVTHGNIDAVPA